MDSGRLKLALALALATSQVKTCPACLQPWLSEGHVAIKQTSLKQGMALAEWRGGGGEHQPGGGEYSHPTSGVEGRRPLAVLEEGLSPKYVPAHEVICVLSPWLTPCLRGPVILVWPAARPPSAPSHEDQARLQSLA